MGLVEDGYAADWFGFVESNAAEHAIELSPSILARLGALPGALLIDTYDADHD